MKCAAKGGDRGFGDAALCKVPNASCSSAPVAGFCPRASMEPENKLLSIRMRLAVSEWRTCGQGSRAQHGTPAQYADLIFSYPLEEKFVADKRRSMDDPDEEIYVSLAVASTTRRQLEERSQKQQTGVATYAGLLVSSFLRRFEIDPRDLRMMRFLAERLDHSATLSEADLIEAVKHVDTNAAFASGLLRQVALRPTSAARPVC